MRRLSFLAAALLLGAGTLSAAVPDAAKKRWPVRVSERSYQHVVSRHTKSGPESAGKSVFLPGADIRALLGLAEAVEPALQPKAGTYKREVEAGRAIGIDRATGKRTSLYTVITAKDGALITAFPGRTGRR